jgi:DNA modification methylase
MQESLFQDQEPALLKTAVMCRAVDNLEFLKTQADESVDLIYCDILYGTGKKFNDYEDLKPNRNDIENHYVSRLNEMHRILKPTGSIYLQMDYRIVHWIRCIMDDIFGYDNFLNEIIWCYSRPSVNSQKNFTRVHDNILLYPKNKGKHTFNTDAVRIDYSEATKSRNKYTAGGSKYAGGTNERKTNELGKIPESYWQIPLIVGNANEKVDYYSQKPKKLIERIILASSNEGDTVADYYLGSGTTAVVCKELNRNFIGCDINPKSIEITNSRLNALS